MSKSNQTSLETQEEAERVERDEDEIGLLQCPSCEEYFYRDFKDQEHCHACQKAYEADQADIMEASRGQY